MKKRGTLVLVRPDAKHKERNRGSDEDSARQAALQPPCWVVLVANGREGRLKALRRILGVEGIARDGINVHGPLEVSGDEWTAEDENELPDRLARYLADTGLRLPLRQVSSLEVRLPEDFPAKLLAAVVEAVAVYPRVDVLLGDSLLRSSLRWELRRDHFSAPPAGEFTTDLNGNSAPLQRVREQVARYAGSPLPALVLGETGTGKEVVASMLHEQSARQGLFMATNAAQLPPQLAESLLFGHLKGSFTGADADRQGRIREADGGTFFLDEAFNLDPAVQGKLLRALNRVDEGIIVVEPLGSSRTQVVHARLVVAAQDDPRTAPRVVGGSAMREDLYFRVAACVIRLPPLRECLDDLPKLCPKLVEKVRPGMEITDDAVSALREHRWPGNVRELRLVLLRALVDGPPNATVLTADAVREALRTAAVPSGRTALVVPCDLAAELKRIEVETMHAALRVANDNHAAAGRLVGMGVSARNFKRRLADAEGRLREMGESIER